MELFLFFTSLLQRFSFKPEESIDKIDLEVNFGLVLYPKPYKLRAIPKWWILLKNKGKYSTVESANLNKF